MTRSQDLDTIAPDDIVVVSAPVKKVQKEKIIEEKKENTSQKSKKDFSQECYNILGHSKSPLSCFLINPDILSFSEQDETEKIYLAARPHWINNLHWMVVSILMFSLPLFLPFVIKYLSFVNFFPVQYQFSSLIFWYLITFIYAFEKFLSWYFNLFLITNQRVVDIDFRNLLNKHFATADLSMIQDTSSSVRGLLGTFFNYGDVLIQTASEKNQIIFEKVPNPEKIIRLLQELRDLEEQNDGEQNNE